MLCNSQLLSPILELVVLLHWVKFNLIQGLEDRFWSLGRWTVICKHERCLLMVSVLIAWDFAEEHHATYCNASFHADVCNALTKILKGFKSTPLPAPWWSSHITKHCFETLIYEADTEEMKWLYPLSTSVLIIVLLAMIQCHILLLLFCLLSRR